MIYVFLADGFEETEAIAPIDILKRFGKEVVTVGVGGGKVTGAHGITVTADITDNDVIMTDKVEMIVLPGGMPGTLNLEKSPVVQAAIKFCADNKKAIGAICAAPSIIGRLGLLSGKKATCFPGFEGELAGAQFVDEAAVRDGNIITSRGAGTATQFAAFLIEALLSKERADRLKAGIQWQE